MSEPIHDDTAAVELPRLRIHHFFVLTTVFAVVMSIGLGVWRLFRSSHPNAVMSEFSAGISLIFCVQSLSQSTSFGIALLGLAWRKRGISFPSQPGHWMAIYLAIVWAYETVLTFVSLLLQNQGARIGVEMDWAMMPMALAFHCFAFAFWVAAYLHEPARIWKLGWAVMAFKSLLSVLWTLFCLGAKCLEWLLEVHWYNAQFDWELFQPLGNYAYIFKMLPNYALLAFLSTAAIIDLRQLRSLHWSHWLVLISTFVSTAIMAVYTHFIFL